MATTNNHSNSDRYIHFAELNVSDVLLGRGSFSDRYQGNVSFRALVAERKPRHAAARINDEKTRIVKEVLDAVATAGGRFLRKVDSVTAARLNLTQGSNDTLWEIVDEHLAIEKIKQAFRDVVVGGFNRRRRPSLTSTNNSNSMGHSGSAPARSPSNINRAHSNHVTTGHFEPQPLDHSVQGNQVAMPLQQQQYQQQPHQFTRESLELLVRQYQENQEASLAAQQQQHSQMQQASSLNTVNHSSINHGTFSASTMAVAPSVPAPSVPAPLQPPAAEMQPQPFAQHPGTAGNPSTWMQSPPPAQPAMYFQNSIMAGTSSMQQSMNVAAAAGPMFQFQPAAASDATLPSPTALVTHQNWKGILATYQASIPHLHGLSGSTAMGQNVAVAATTPNPFTTDDLNRLLQIWTMAVSENDMDALRQLQAVALSVAQLPSHSPLLQLGRADLQSLMTMIQSLASIV